MNHDVLVLFEMTATGAVFGVAYHILKALKNTLCLGIIGCNIVDFFYWLFLTVCAYFMLFTTNDGILRAYEFCGMFLGAILYFFTVGKWFFRCFEYIFKNILKIFDFILKILLTPVQFLDKILIVVFKKFGGAGNNAKKGKTGKIPVSKG